MSRRRRVRILLVGLLVLAAGAVVVPFAGAEPHVVSDARSNVVVIMTDDQTVESMRIMTNVNQLIGDTGVTFANNFASYPLCCPSRATYLTGQYAHNHGVRSNGPPDGGYSALDSSNTLPVWLQAAGYHTVHIGKYLNGYGLTNPTEVPLGWSDWQGLTDHSTYSYFGYTLNDNGTLVTYGSEPADYQTDVLTQRAVDAIDEHAGSAEPLFLSVAYLAPHSQAVEGEDDLQFPLPAPRHEGKFADEPLPMPPSFNEADVSDKPEAIKSIPRYDAATIDLITTNYRARLASLLAVDEGVARIHDALERTGQLADTLLVFTSDNGFMHGEHRLSSGKYVSYEESVRVPLAVSGPGVAHGTVRTNAANVDLAPTIVAATGATPRRLMDGRSLLPVLADPGLDSRRDLLLEGLQDKGTYVGIRTDRFVYVEYKTGERELYDLLIDPYQLTNRAGSPTVARMRTALAARLAVLRACAGASCG